MSKEPAAPAAIRFRRYAAGRVFVFSHGDPRHVAAATRALKRCVVLEAKVDSARFVAMMGAEGIPESVALAFLARVSLDDEAYLQDEFPT